jgi:PhnB protein
MDAPKPIFSGIIPHLAVKGGESAIAFYQEAFGAELVHKMPKEDGRLLHAFLRVNGAPLFLHDDFSNGMGGVRPPSDIGASVTIHIALGAAADVDAVYERARNAGAEEIMAPTDAFWGDRYGKLRDPFGHVWSLGAPLSSA